jgi:hypothetical protein
MAINRGSSSFIATKADARQALANIEANLNSVLAALQITAEDKLLELGKQIEERSNEIAPEDTGELKSLSYAESERVGDTVTVAIGYRADHAAYTHENTPSKTDYQNPTTPGTHFKFLQTALTEKENDLMNELADALKAQLK